MTKDLLPGYWDTSVGGHVSPGESTYEALKRETLEELGLEEFTYKFLKKYIWESPRERELVYSFKGISENNPLINKDEIEEGRFWSMEEIRRSLDKNIFTPNFEHEFYSVVIA
jgi:isopentenyldiphosphate isomerase